MKIVILDAQPLLGDELSFSELQGLGNVVLHDNTAPHEIQERLQDAEAVFTNKVRLSKEMIDAAPHLRFIGVLATGYDIVDIKAAKAKNIPVCNVPAYANYSAAQSTMALLLELTQGVGEHARAVQNGSWSLSPAFSFWNHPLYELAGKKLLIVGYGSIGQAFGKMAQAFGMEIYAALLPNRTYSACEKIPRLPLEEGLKLADVVSLHCPLSTDTEQLMNKDRLALLKASAFLLNTSRGKLIDESALADALDRRCFAGYAADVLSVEPPPANHPLLKARKNCIITPHIAWATVEARSRLRQISSDNLRAFKNGKAQNVVNP